MLKYFFPALLLWISSSSSYGEIYKTSQNNRIEFRKLDETTLPQFDWMWISVVGTREMLAKGFDISKIIDVGQGWLAPPYDYPCLSVTTSRDPNTKCPEWSETFETGVIACFKTPAAKELFSVTGFETACPP